MLRSLTTGPAATIFGVTSLLLVSWLSGSSARAVAAEPGETEVAGALRGRLTFDFVNWIRQDTEAIVDLYLPSASFRRSASGRYGWRHASGDLVRTEGCGNYVNRLVVDRADHGSEFASPCSAAIETASGARPIFEFARLSPDGKRIAAELKHYAGSAWQYSVVVFEAGEMIAVFNDFSSPAWTPDGRLILSGNGLYMADVDGAPSRIDDGWLGYGVINPDVRPDGSMLVFEWNERLWVMSLDGKEKKELVWGPMQYRFPAWSPGGDHVAFIATSGSAHSEVDRAIHVIDVRDGSLQRLDVSTYGGKLNHVPFGPLSWTPGER